MGLLLSIPLGGNFWSIKKAHAAMPVSGNLELAKSVVDDLSPYFGAKEQNQDISSSFTPDGFLAKPLVTETQVAQEEKKVTPRAARQTAVKKTAVAKAAVKPAVARSANIGHYFPYGYCTYYVSQRRVIPWSGNAITWLSGARSFGFATGNTPQVGAIAVTSEGGRTGHVAMVDAVNGNQITLTEMNYRGFGVISSRTISASYGAILGYIY